jgi:hypothetical protein
VDWASSVPATRNLKAATVDLALTRVARTVRAMSPLPFRPESAVPTPASVAEYPNGKIPLHALRPCGIGNFVLEPDAARAMRAMVAAAARDGVRLSATGTYRSYAAQVAAFDGTQEALWDAPYVGRYVPEHLWATYEASGRRFTSDVRMWNGVRWRRRAGTAGAARPGTSNHGTGVAVDLAELNAAGSVVSLSAPTLAWLAANGPRFGYWNTVKSEKWHWCWIGPVSQAVLDYEAPAVSVPEPQPSPGNVDTSTPSVPAVDWAAIAATNAKVKATRYPGRPVVRGSKGDTVFAIQWQLIAVGGITVKPDSSFGAKTQAAVIEFQRKRNLKPDGIVGRFTWRALELPL